MSSSARTSSIVVMVTVVAVAALGLTGCQPMPKSGRFATQQHTAAQITTVANQVYGRAPNRAGATVDLLLDLYLPPTVSSAPRPAVILVHGGAFTTGSKAQMAGTARGYAQLGFVAAAINYRLDPGAGESAQRQLEAALAAIDDGMEAVRWLRSKASTHRIDTTRIAMIGSSAGGFVALGVGAIEDPTPGGPLAAHAPTIRAAVSTGATLTPGMDAGLVTFERTDAPALMYHHATDTATRFTSAYARRHCDALRAAGPVCTFVEQPGSGHTVALAVTAEHWTKDLGTFLWQQMDLFALV